MYTVGSYSGSVEDGLEGDKITKKGENLTRLTIKRSKKGKEKLKQFSET